jgi:hypothetical protein
MGWASRKEQLNVLIVAIEKVIPFQPEPQREEDGRPLDWSHDESSGPRDGQQLRRA